MRRLCPIVDIFLDPLDNLLGLIPFLLSEHLAGGILVSKSDQPSPSSRTLRNRSTLLGRILVTQVLKV
jgi:hypothetical protein